MYFPYRVIDFLFLLNIDAFFPAIILGHIVIPENNGYIRTVRGSRWQQSL